jgi:hypothetical protein
MKLQLTVYKKIYTIETENDDLPIDEYFDHFRGILVSSGFHTSTIDDYIIELSDLIKE